MITIKEGDLFSAPRGIICHQVNCKGKMGNGVAKTFKDVFPCAYSNYLDICNSVKSSSELLGRVSFCIEETGASCCMFAQDDYGNKKFKGCYTNYDAFRNCCISIARYVSDFYDSKTYPVNMPFGIGCGLGGGDWEIIRSILEEEFKDCNVILWKLK